MGNILQIFVLLSVLITIPRWAAVLSGVDEPVSAWIMGLLIEVSAFACAQALSLAREANSVHRDAWELLPEEQQKKKPDHLPALKGAWSLMLFYALLLALSLGVQVPFYVARFRGVPVQAIVWPGLDWLYIGLLDVSPEIATTALIVAGRYIFVASKVLAGRRKGRIATLLDAAIKQAESKFRVEEKPPVVAKPAPETVLAMSEEEFIRLYRAGELAPKGAEVQIVAKQMGVSRRKVYRLMQANRNGNGGGHGS